ncbi:MAG: hypothetical protein L6265_06740 [Thermoplasmatales archaeon]|nr:hypothetical protein [Thermoplasmatales archaeon]
MSNTPYGIYIITILFILVALFVTVLRLYGIKKAIKTLILSVSVIFFVVGAISLFVGFIFYTNPTNLYQPFIGKVMMYGGVLASAVAIIPNLWKRLFILKKQRSVAKLMIATLFSIFIIIASIVAYPMVVRETKIVIVLKCTALGEDVHVFIDDDNKTTPDAHVAIAFNQIKKLTFPVRPGVHKIYVNASVSGVKLNEEVHLNEGDTVTREVWVGWS